MSKSEKCRQQCAEHRAKQRGQNEEAKSKDAFEKEDVLRLTMFIEE